MTHKIIETDRAPSAIGPYSQGIAASPWLFISGQIGINPETGEFVSNSFEDQARQALENLKQIVIAGGCDMKNIVSVDVFLTNIENFALFNQIYQEYFSEDRPARAVVGVNELPKGALVEIKCIAAKEF